MTIDAVIQLIREQGSTLAKPVEVEGMPPMTFACSLSSRSATEVELLALPFECPVDLREFWAEVASARLFVDQEYGQWGLEISDPTQSEELTNRFREERKSDYRRGDLVVGRFLGDSDLLLVRCDPETSDFGSVLIALPLDPRVDWDSAAGAFSEFLENYVTSGGEKFWRT